MKQTLGGFILDWNEHHNRFVFSAQEVPVTGRPTEVEIRYSPAKYHRYLSIEQWDRLVAVVEAKSHGTMYVVSNEKLFRSGIVSIAVASANHNYQERIVVGVLRWIGEEFFQNEEQNKDENG